MKIIKLKSKLIKTVGCDRLAHFSCSTPFALGANAFILPCWTLLIGVVFSVAEEGLTAWEDGEKFDPWDAVANFAPWGLIGFLIFIIV